MNSVQPSQCPVCHYAHSTYVTIEKSQTQANVHDVKCWVCGTYSIGKNTKIQDGKCNDYRHLISGYIQEYNLKNGINKSILLNDKLIDEIVEKTKDYHVPEKMDKLLLALGEKTKVPGKEITIAGELAQSYAYAKDQCELMYYITSYIDAKMLRAPQGQYSPVTVTPKGWERIREIQRSGAESKLGFVAMSFKNKFDELYEAIKEGVKLAEMGYEAKRLNDPQDPELIDNSLIARIRASRFMIADLSENTHGVYYEAGFMRALGRQVIYTCKKRNPDETLVDKPGEKLHFDVTHYPILFWEETNLPKFKEDLAAWVGAWII